MTQLKKFIIDHIDPLGQGVFKKDGEIFFIPKTLPGEEGEFEVLRSSKGVNFGKLVKVSEKSELRQKPKCPHYDECNGCSYLHTNLSEEHKLKISHLKRMLSLGLGHETELEIITNNQRFDYRNRIQLHYHQRAMVIGFKEAKSSTIIPIKNCILASKLVQEKVLELTKDFNWLKVIPPKSPERGHLELFEKNGKLSISWNQKYAEGGFEQVNPQVNELFLEKITNLFSDHGLSILDLFGGSGNLVKGISDSKHVSVDIYPEKDRSHTKINLNLFESSALSQFQSQSTKSFNTMFVDPPRSGFTYLDHWTQAINPNQLLYVSCHPATMVRDLKKIMDTYQIEQTFLLDFFPGTKHFEAAIYLTKKQQ